MAFGTVLTRHWQPPVSPLVVTAWQLAAGGVLLLPVLAWLQPGIPAVSLASLLGLAWLGLVGAALTYILWFRGIARLGPSRVAPLALLSPVVAVLLGWWALGQVMTPVQLAGMLVVVGSIALSQAAQRDSPARPTVPRSPATSPPGRAIPP
jgi:probable blue pigment (indigoidine) exporter